MQELRAKLSRFLVSNGRNAVLVGASLLAAGAVLAFVLGQNVFGGLSHGANNGTNPVTASILGQDTIASIAALDSDDDGLTDLEEARYRSDPRNPDTDHDGYDDGVEVENGYDPTAAPAEGVDQSTPALTAARDTSLLDQLGLEPVSSSVDGINVGGIGGLPADDLAALVGQAVPSDERLAELEVDKLLAATSGGLPAVDVSTVKVRKGADRADIEAYLQEAFTVITRNSPFPESYTVETFLDDVSSGNRDMLERLKLALETMDRELIKIEVPEQALAVHVHTLAIARGGAVGLEQLLAAQNDSDATLQFIGRTVFLWNEIRALVREADGLLT